VDREQQAGGRIAYVDRWAGRRADLSVIVGRRLGPG
jgi:hypothetical protein